ncbi:MAG TPA: GxxExxY protein [Fimbriimonadaceae bacterium]|jgi:GxxExxY protein
MQERGSVNAAKYQRKPNSEDSKENKIASIIVDAALAVHRELGPGLLESVYEMALAYELLHRGVSVRRQVPLPVVYKGVMLEEGFRIDLLVEEVVVVELKSVETISHTHTKTLLTYLRLSNKKLGLMINFSEALLKNGIKRVVKGL